MKNLLSSLGKTGFAAKLFAVLLMLQFSLTASAAKWSDSGAYNISWYDKNQTEFNISTPQELAGVAYLINNGFTTFKGKTINLAADINLSGKEWVPIGKSSAFEGTFDGHGCSVKNFSLTNAENEYCGFWGKLSYAVLKNFTLQGSISTDQRYVGFVVADAQNTEFNNIETKCSINILKTSGFTTSNSLIYIGGVAAYSKQCNFTNLKSDNSIDLEYGHWSGENVFHSMNIKIGGIAGYGSTNRYNKCQLTNDFEISFYGVNNGSSEYEDVVCGGIVGLEDGWSGYVTSCFVKTTSFRGYHYNGKYDTVQFRYGGITAKSYYGDKIKNCVAVTSEYFVTGYDNLHTDSFFSGISQNTPSNFGGCYSNNDVNKYIQKYGQIKSTKKGTLPFLLNK